MSLLPVLALAQSIHSAPTQSDNDLFSVLTAVHSEEESQALLISHRHLITDQLWERLIKEADHAYDTNDSTRSLLIYGIARQSAVELNDRPRLAKSLNRIGFVYLGVGNYKSAKDYAGQSLTLAEALKDNKLSASALLTIGMVSLWQGDHEEAIGHLQRCLVIFKELNERLSMADALVYLGQAHSATGNYVQAFNDYSQAMDIVKGLNERQRLENLLTSIGTLYAEQGDYEKMFDYLDQGLQIAKEINDQLGMATILLNKGIAYREQGEYEMALKFLQDSLKIGEATKSPGFLIYPQTALGSLYQSQGKYGLAADCLNRSLVLAEQVGDRPEAAATLWHLGELHHSQGNDLKAIELADRAAALADRINLPGIGYLALTLKGKAHLALKQPALAQQSLQNAILTIEQLRSQVSGGEPDYQRFFQNRVAPYHTMIDLFVNQNDPAQALDYAERAKARVLLDVLRNGRININKSLSQQEQLEERRLYSEMVALNAQVNAEKSRQPADHTRIEEIETRLQRARSAYEEFQVTLFAAHPELKVKRGLLPPLTMDDAAALIPDARTILLEYVVTNDSTFLFALTRASTRSAKIATKVYSISARRSDLANLVEDFRKMLAANHPGFRQRGGELYNLLVKPVEHLLRGKTTLCIVPDGPLWELPFQALQTPADKYLQELHSLYYAPSLQVLREMRKRAAGLKSSSVSKDRQAESVSTSRLYAIGNPTIGGEALARVQAVRNAPFVSLPETEREVQTIGNEVYGPKASNIHVGSAAREEVVKVEMGKYQVIHFATHGVLNDRSPLYSYLVLATGEHSNEDGLLEAWELMEMDLKAQMVVLSACDTARGHVGAGEGMIGMTWALFVAGVPTTVASQWKVPSETTTRLMVAFHKKAQQMTKAEAWREAALEMIRDPRYRMKPFYWAGFVVVGDGGF